MLKNISSNWMMTILQIVITFVLLPFTIRALGQEQYGTWVLITSLTSYLTMLALGIPMATVRFVARYAAAPDAQDDLDRAVGSCAGLYAIMGFVAMVLGVVLFGIFHVTYDIPLELQARANAAFGLVVVYIAFGFFAQLPYGIMSAHHDFVVKNLVQMGGLFLRLASTYALLVWWPSFVWLAVIQIGTLAFEFTTAMVLVRRRYPRIRVRFSNFDREMVKRLFSFSMFVLMLQVGGQLAFQTDSLVIGAFLPVSSIPYFTVASSLAVYTMEFVIAIAAVVMPTTTSLEAQGKMDELRVVFLKWSKITFSLTLLAGAYLLVLGPRFIAWWIGPEYEGPAGSVLVILMLGNLAFLPVRGVALPTLMGLGKPGKPTIAFLVASVLNLWVSIALVRPLGLNGVAVGTAIPNVAFAGYVLFVTCRALEVPLGRYLRYVTARVIPGSIPLVGVLLWFRYGLDVKGFPGLFAGGVASLLIFGAVWVGYVYRNDEYVSLDGLPGARLMRGT